MSGGLPGDQSFAKRLYALIRFHHCLPNLSHLRARGDDSLKASAGHLGLEKRATPLTSLTLTRLADRPGRDRT